MKPFVLIGNPENRRVEYFRAACEGVGVRDLLVLSWQDVLADNCPLRQHLAGAAGLRIESPGEDFGVERRLIVMGSQDAVAEGRWSAIGEAEAAALTFDHGRLRLQRQWYLGWVRALSEIRQAAADGGVPVMNAPEEIAVLFDKDATQERLAAAGVPVAQRLGIPADFAELHGRMREMRVHRVFLKPCHSSSASGIVALQWDGGERWQATTSAVWSGTEETPRLHNSLRLQHLREVTEIRRVVDAVCRERALAEQWFPKASLNGRTYDLRILVIAGTPAHVVVRTSRSPITNLHLGNARGDAGEVRAQLGEAVWTEGLDVAKTAAACFPGCLYTAVDLMVSANRNRFCVAEVNAFGDLIPGVLWQGMTPCEAELRAWGEGRWELLER